MPSDSSELVAQLKQAISKETDVHTLGKKGEPDLLKNENTLGIGKAHMIKPGKNILLLGIGPIIKEGLKAREELRQENIDLGVASMGSVKPLDVEFLKKCHAEGYKKWISLEEHHTIGGLGSALAEWLSENNYDNIQLIRMGIRDHFVHKLGSQQYVRAYEGLSTSSIVNLVKSL